MVHGAPRPTPKLTSCAARAQPTITRRGRAGPAGSRRSSGFLLALMRYSVRRRSELQRDQDEERRTADTDVPRGRLCVAQLDCLPIKDLSAMRRRRGRRGACGKECAPHNVPRQIDRLRQNDRSPPKAQSKFPRVDSGSGSLPWAGTAGARSGFMRP
jgi:hypothetical protein